MQILIIDDALEDVRLFQRLLRQCRILNPVQAYSGGDQFLEFLRDCDGASPPQPCLIFVDLIMAPMSGLDTIAAWSHSSLAARSIVVMMSGLTELKAMHGGYQAGARTFLVKPIHQDEFLQTLGSLGDQISMAETPEGFTLSWRYAGLPTAHPPAAPRSARINALSNRSNREPGNSSNRGA